MLIACSRNRFARPSANYASQFCHGKRRKKISTDLISARWQGFVGRNTFEREPSEMVARRLGLRKMFKPTPIMALPGNGGINRHSVRFGG